MLFRSEGEGVDSLEDEEPRPRPSEVTDRIQQRHVRASNQRISDLRMERRDADELDRPARVVSRREGRREGTNEENDEPTVQATTRKK